jgi:integrase
MTSPPKTDWPTHLWLRGTRFYARLRVPPSLGRSQTHLQRSLETSRYPEAVKRLPVVVGDLRLQLEAMRAAGQAPTKRPLPPVDQAAAWWRREIERAGGTPGGGIPASLENEWEADLQQRLDPDNSGQDAGEADALRLADLVLGRILPVEAELDRFIAERRISVRYAGRHRRAVGRLKRWLLKRFGTDDLRRVSRREAGHFVDDLVAGGLSAATVNSLVSSLGVYWTWLGQRVGVEGNPWSGQTRRARETETVADKRPFTDDEVKRLLSGDTTGTLHDLMRIAALSGMRIDEIARLTVATSSDGLLRVTEGKTKSSLRSIPVHTDLASLIARRQVGKASTDRLFDELRAPPSRKKELSAKASERFTAYRRSVGVDERVEGQRQSNVDFHSFRRWFVTKAEEAGQPPHLISAVVGHAEGRKGMTLGTYSGGPSVEQRKAVVESVRLPAGTLIESPASRALDDGANP